jgi:magnesium chelatase family protein
LLAATNPCPCGYSGDREKPCICAPAALERYRNRISGPILDRIDLFVGVPRLSSSEIATKNRGTTSSEILARVQEARAKQAKRFGNTSKTNAAMEEKDFRHAGFSIEALKFALEAVDRLGLSGRAHNRIRKIARTIADLAGSDSVVIEHMAEAVGYRAR